MPVVVQGHTANAVTMDSQRTQEKQVSFTAVLLPRRGDSQPHGTLSGRPGESRGVLFSGGRLQSVAMPLPMWAPSAIPGDVHGQPFWCRSHSMHGSMSPGFPSMNTRRAAPPRHVAHGISRLRISLTRVGFGCTQNERCFFVFMAFAVLGMPSQ